MGHMDDHQDAPYSGEGLDDRVQDLANGLTPDAPDDAPVDDYDEDDALDAPDDDGDDDGNEDEDHSARFRGQSLPTRITGSKKKDRIGQASSRFMSKEKQRKALELRKAGSSYSQIATAVGYYDASAARKAVLSAFGEIIQEESTEVRRLQVERLNHMLLTLWPKVQQGDERAIDTSLRVMDKMDRLMGTEAPQQHEVHSTSQSAVLVIDGNKDDYVRAMKRMAGLDPDGNNPHTPALDLSGPEDRRPPSGYDGPPAIDAPQVVDGAVDEERMAVLTPVPPPEGQQKPKKTYKFGVDPGGDD